MIPGIRKSTHFIYLLYRLTDPKWNYLHLLYHRIDYSFLISLHWRTIPLYWCVQRLHWAICCQFDISPARYNHGVCSGTYAEETTPSSCWYVPGGRPWFGVFLRRFSFKESTNLSLCKIILLTESVTLETPK